MTLSEAQLSHLEGRLREERAQALAALNRSVAENGRQTEEERSGDVSEMPTHPADLGTDTIDQEIDSADATRVSRQLAEIDDALHRLIHTPDRYGTCEDTGAPIPYERLELIPWARTCAQTEGGTRPER